MEDLNERARSVLHAVIREYIATGGPVGSHQLARTQFDVSSATLRNVMADLEALGYLEKPHTSAGRVPTGRAYRFYVDSLMQLRQPEAVGAVEQDGVGAVFTKSRGIGGEQGAVWFHGNRQHRQRGSRGTRAARRAGADRGARGAWRARPASGAASAG